MPRSIRMKRFLWPLGIFLVLVAFQPGQADILAGQRQFVVERSVFCVEVLVFTGEERRIGFDRAGLVKAVACRFADAERHAVGFVAGAILANSGGIAIASMAGGSKAEALRAPILEDKVVDYILELAKSVGQDPRVCVPGFFKRYSKTLARSMTSQTQPAGLTCFVQHRGG